jgi:hypothetical protein
MSTQSESGTNLVPWPDQELTNLLREQVMTGECASLLPDHDLYLFGPREELRLFAELFRDTWTQVTEQHKDVILRHWKNGEHSPPRPQIVAALATEWYVDATDRTHDRDTVAQTCSFGHKLVFSTRMFRSYAPIDARAKIAEELAHTYFTAMGEANHLEAAANPRSELPSHEDPVFVESERLAAELCTEWGFGTQD